jgi:hypothetical protein
MALYNMHIDYSTYTRMPRLKRKKLLELAEWAAEQKAKAWDALKL